MITIVHRLATIYDKMRSKEPLNVDMVVAAVDGLEDKQELELQLSIHEPDVKSLVLMFNDVDEPHCGSLELDQAKEIIEFIYLNQGPQPGLKTRIIFACEGGVSRSATLAMFIDFCWNRFTIERFMNTKLFPNKHMLNTLSEAYRDIFGSSAMDSDTIECLCHLSEVRWLRKSLRDANAEVDSLTIDRPGPGRAFGEV